MLLGTLGFFIIAVLSAHNFRAAVLVSIVVTPLIGWMLGDVKYGGVFSMPPNITSVVGQTDLAGVIFSFMLINLFDSFGTLIGVTDKAGLTDHKGKCTRMKQALYVDSISSVMGSLAGTSAVTASSGLLLVAVLA